MLTQQKLQVPTKGRGFYLLDQHITPLIKNVSAGLCHIFIPHTSASVIADPQVLRDLEVFMGHLVPDGDPLFKHTAEGKDDMPAHIRSVLTQTSVSTPIIEGKLALGIWQSIFLWEHRLTAHHRFIMVTVIA